MKAEKDQAIHVKKPLSASKRRATEKRLAKLAEEVEQEIQLLRESREVRQDLMKIEFTV